MLAELVRVTLHQVDIKIVSGDRMHILQWRRNLLWDEVLLDGRRQAHSAGLAGREKVYGLVFGADADGHGGEHVMLMIDPRTDHGKWGNTQRLSGVRLEARNGPILSYGTLDPKSLEKPDTFSDWLKKSLGMEWG